MSFWLLLLNRDVFQHFLKSLLCNITVIFIVGDLTVRDGEPIVIYVTFFLSM